MPASRASGVVVYRGKDGIDAIEEYSRRLVAALAAHGSDVRYVPDGPAALHADAADPAWILLQYNPFRYGRAGVAPRLLLDVRQLRRRSRVPLVVMVHEAWIDIADWRSAVVGGWQRAQLRGLLHLADGVMTSTQALADAIGGGAVHLPIATTITPVASSRRCARARLGLDERLVVALFGRSNPSRALDYAESAIAALVDAHGVERLIVLNLGADAPQLHVPPGVQVSRPGALPADALSLRLRASDVVLLPFTDGVSTRRTTLMAALAHGLPVLGLHGANTDAVLADARDALALTPIGDIAAFSRTAVELTLDRPRLQTIGDAGRRLYEARFDWPVLAGNVASVLATITARSAPRPSAGRLGRLARRPDVRPTEATRRPQSAPGSARDVSTEVVFIAHDVGGLGGMQRHSGQLVTRLLDAGRPVTVIARTCSLEPQSGLRFVRVPTPSRPFTVAYPAFFAVASLLVTRHHDALLHATGAIVTNRVDVTTIHYCHRAAASQEGSRASQAGTLYRLNAIAHGILSRAAEGWCYAPRRTGVMCAVSLGVAAEIEHVFPAMAGAVRTIPNGVDCAVFRPDPAARRELRGELALDERLALALFAGGDWNRKGLKHAVDALALASDWALVVAGSGDPEPYLLRARQAGTASRLHFLGTVREMPRVYAAADAFVLPSTYEAFPLVILEAAASGLPLLVSRFNGTEELLDDGLSGWFINRDARDIARRLTMLRSDPELARTMGERARIAASHYSWETMAATYLALYAELQMRRDGSALAITQLVPHTEPVDGIYRASLDLTTGLSRTGSPSLVLTLAHGTGRPDWERVASVREAMPFLACSPRQPARVARVARIAGGLPSTADVVIAHRIDLLNAAAMIARRQRARLVFHAHNAQPDWMRWGDPLRVFGTRLVTTVIVASEFMRDTWARQVPAGIPIKVVEYPIACDFFDLPTATTRDAARAGFGVDRDALVVGYFGRLDEDKGVHVLAAAAAELAGDRPVHVLLQGAANLGVPSSHARRYRALCETSLGDAARTWVAAAPDVRPLLAASDVIAVPSIWSEPSGLTVSEALATGTPVVASRTGGIPAQMPDSPLTALVEPGDPRQLANAIRRVASVQPTVASRLALRDHVVTRRSPEITTTRYLAALRTPPRA